MGCDTDAWLLHCECWSIDQHCYRQLDMDAVSLGFYLQESSSYTGLTSVSLLSVPVLLQFLDN